MRPLITVTRVLIRREETRRQTPTVGGDVQTHGEARSDACASPCTLACTGSRERWGGSPEVGREPRAADTWCWTSGPENLEGKNFCGLSHLVTRRKLLYAPHLVPVPHLMTEMEQQVRQPTPGGHSPAGRMTGTSQEPSVGSGRVPREVTGRHTVWASGSHPEGWR